MEKQDRISQLPDPLVYQILSHLHIKESVKTSVLSTRWRSLWLCGPRLEFVHWHFSDLNGFISFGDKFFDSNRRASHIDKLKLTVDENLDDNTSYLKSWIDAAAKRKIQHLDLCCSEDTSFEMPLRLYTYESLVSLKLYEVNLGDVEFVFLPRLITLHLKYIWYRKDASLERLISCCPVLEKLKIVGCVYGNANVFRVLSRSLKKLRIIIEKVIKMCLWESDSFPDEYFGSEFVIDAPLLRFLSVNDKLSKSFIIKDMDSNAKVDISLPFGLDVFDEANISSRRSSIRGFLLGISKVEDMTICKDTFKLIHQYSKTEPLPQFGYMSSLRVTIRVSDWKWLPTFLESCPNLKSLILVWNTNSKKLRSMELYQFKFSSVPKCLLSSLEFVDIKTSILGYFPEMKLVRYLQENSTILKKLTLRLNHYQMNDKYFVKELLSIPIRSVTCQVVIY